VLRRWRAADLGLDRRVTRAALVSAYDRVPAHATAFAHRDATYLVKHTGPVGAAAYDPEDFFLRFAQPVPPLS
jgi:hypothetical protein